ncbi:hypothetical protein COU18_00760 [Candidatus Kaiserbacteria bacterium CG10_big_fil_rev_8_21_14_0_10_51_14]|uniref:YgjP-like metallopeptidase domain-containing protein n=1 Tax=Candidatus Kaiserbacteria bacterium CG10_big_fil_rev_8_21_14_0_10_51_14 TaxID=1974610 RepID=A0A2H0UC49_9BACT|nr:MAG: hypothetical protein COU18_00760 [Candidatus Kaiserbacteria bacterium CG10_big_fil_rev_8_21_14_0_10_51_14]
MAIRYTVKVNARSRSMRLTVHPDARVVVTAPQFFGQGAIERFIAKHSGWIEKHVEKAKGRTVIRIRKGEIADLKKRALAQARARTLHFAKMYGLTYGKISIRAQKSRWGSCSRRGNLSFNYKIAALPAHITDYIIVHELCHLREMNHAKDFWTLVAKAIPNHKATRKELRNIVIMFD